MNRNTPLSERPLTKMQYFGPSGLSNAELLSLVIGTEVDVARKAISYLDEISASFGTVEVRELEEVAGIGPSKASAVVAAMELGKRTALSSKVGQRISRSDEVADLMRAEFGSEKQEHFVVFLLNSKLRLESRVVVSKGNLDSAPVHPREVFAPAVKRQAAAIIVAHNHPTGDPTPSPQDLQVTERLLESSKILGIKLLDHVIVGGGNTSAFTSMKTEGYLD